MSPAEVVADYHERAARGAVVDYASYDLLADPRPEILRDELPGLVRDGHSSPKVFSPATRVEDEQFLDVPWAAREHGCMVCVHAENHGMISGWASGWWPRPDGAEVPRPVAPAPRRGRGAINRAIAMAAFIDQP
ncbi:MAG: hypothetical protein R3D28_00450 [Geminicoccaceae bacterium]